MGANTITKLSVLISKDIHKKAKLFATEREIPLKDVVSEALETFIATKTGAKKKEVLI